MTLALDRNTGDTPKRSDREARIEADRIAVPLARSPARARRSGKFLFVGGEKLWIKGVTYGTFRTGPHGDDYPNPDVVERDFAAMETYGFNSLRTYTAPPRWLLDTAARHGLKVMVGLPWEQHTAFLDSKESRTRIEQSVRAGVAQCADHEALLCYAIGNEIPAPVVRWYGSHRVERFLHRLFDLVKKDDPNALATYVNFPTTEYLTLPFVDFVSFNVYLESKEKLAPYLARLQNVAGERPLLMAEIGLDSRRNGQREQAASLAWQLDTTIEAGCVGAFVFSWTDEWYRGGNDIDDWDFGLTTRDRQPKPAVNAVARRFAQVPFEAERPWPKISVVVCSYNGSRTIRETLASLQKLTYPNYEVIVVDDGSKDNTGAMAREFPVRLIQTENRGLSAARNTGAEAATGEIVAYIDDDAFADPHWLAYLADKFMRTDFAGIGGPNLAPADDGQIAACVANAPGGPAHVLLTDEVAEHIPGCNMAYRRDRLLAVGGFDPRFRVAGDDVDVCWRLQERGWTLGFAPAALVWHHRRGSLRAYFKQQKGYARSEALLAEKWPNKYNQAGHQIWHGRIYGRGTIEALFPKARIYHGTWGTALFQSVYQPAQGMFSALPLMPEWYFVLFVLLVLATLSLSWPPMAAALPVLLLAVGVTIIQAARGGDRASFEPQPKTVPKRLALVSVVIWLHLLQPAARLLGRIQHGLGPWSWPSLRAAPLWPRSRAIWSERWRSSETLIEGLERELKQSGAVPLRGGDFDDWDLSISGGLFGAVRTLGMVEEHGAGKQLFRLRAWPKPAAGAVVLITLFAAWCFAAASESAFGAATVLGILAGGLGFLTYVDCAGAMQTWSRAVEGLTANHPDMQVL